MSLIPEPYRLAASIIVAVALLAGAAFAGMKVGEWKAGAAFRLVEREHARMVARLEEEAVVLRSKIAEQNHALEMVNAKAETAAAVQREAQKRADDLAVFSRSRMDKLERSVMEATTAGEVLRRYWELRQ